MIVASWQFFYPFTRVLISKRVSGANTIQINAIEVR